MGCPTTEIQEGDLVLSAVGVSFDNFQHHLVSGIGVFLALGPPNAEVIVTVSFQTGFGEGDNAEVFYTFHLGRRYSKVRICSSNSPPCSLGRNWLSRRRYHSCLLEMFRWDVHLCILGLG